MCNLMTCGDHECSQTDTFFVESVLKLYVTYYPFSCPKCPFIPRERYQVNTI